MKSEKGVALFFFVIIMIVLLLIFGVILYTVVGPNGPLNRQRVEPLNQVNTTTVDFF